MVDLVVDVPRARHHADAADVHWRRAARCARYAGLGNRACGRQPMSGAPLLSIEKLTVAFGGVRAVSELDLEIRSGERLALVGESGSGKSVTALAVLRLLADAQISGA